MLAFKDMLEQHDVNKVKKQEKQRRDENSKDPLEGRPLPMQAHSAPTKQRVLYHTHASLSSSHPPAWKQKQRKSLASKRQTPTPGPHHSQCCNPADLASWALCASLQQRKHRAPPRRSPLLHGIASCAALTIVRGSESCRSTTVEKELPRISLVQQTDVHRHVRTDALLHLHLHELAGTAYVSWEVSIVK